MPTDLGTLYLLVSEAIRRADVLDDLGAPGATEAHLDVSLLEEAIAALVSASEPEGALARRGAVRAAVRAGDLRRAETLASRFGADLDASQELSDQLEEILHDREAVRGGPRTEPSAADLDSSDRIDERSEHERDVTFAGHRGRELLLELQRLSAGAISIGDAFPELAREPDGTLRVKVTNETIDLLSRAN